MFFKKIASAITFAFVVIAPTAIAENLRTSVSADIDSDGVPIAFSQIGKIPTINYSIPADQMLSLLKQDLDEKRVHFSVTKPSHLDNHIESTENIPNGIKSKSGSFAANSTGRICITVVYLNVSSSVSTSGVQGGITQSVIRNCAPTDTVNYGFSQWARSTIGVTTTNATGLQNLYNGFVVLNRFNPNGGVPANGLRGQSFSSPYGAAAEWWGTTFFNTYGLNGTAQDIVLVVASWV